MSRVTQDLVLPHPPTRYWVLNTNENLLPFQGKMPRRLGGVAALQVHGRIFQSEPVVVRGHRLSVVGAVPARARRADLFQKLSVTIKDVHLRLRLILQSDR